MKKLSLSRVAQHEQLLQKARRDYPIGTKYLDPKRDPSSSKAHRQVQGELKVHIFPDEKCMISDGWGGAVYHDGMWAKIYDENCIMKERTFKMKLKLNYQPNQTT